MRRFDNEALKSPMKVKNLLPGGERRRGVACDLSAGFGGAWRARQIAP